MAGIGAGLGSRSPSAPRLGEDAGHRVPNVGRTPTTSSAASARPTTTPRCSAVDATFGGSATRGPVSNVDFGNGTDLEYDLYAGSDVLGPVASTWLLATAVKLCSHGLRVQVHAGPGARHPGRRSTLPGVLREDRRRLVLWSMSREHPEQQVQRLRAGPPDRRHRSATPPGTPASATPHRPRLSSATGTPPRYRRDLSSDVVGSFKSHARAVHARPSPRPSPRRSSPLLPGSAIRSR